MAKGGKMKPRLKKSRKNKGKKLQVIKLNLIKIEAPKVKLSKVVKVQPIIGRPERNQFPLTALGRIEFKKARKEYYSETKKIDKVMNWVAKYRNGSKHEFKEPLVKWVVKKELSDMLTDPIRLNKIRNGKIVVSTIRLLKSKNIVRTINHNEHPDKRAVKVLKLKARSS